MEQAQTGMKERPRVVVTGVGAITSQGRTASALWEGVREGRCTIREVRHLPMDGYGTRLAGEVQEYVVPRHDYPRPEGFRDRAMDFALVAAEEAFEAGAGERHGIPAERWGVVMGTCNAALLSGERWLLDVRNGRRQDARCLKLMSPQALAEAVGGAFGVRGPVLSVDTACAAGANAVGYGGDLIRSGLADAVLAGGTDALSDVLIAGFNSLESLSPLPAAPYTRDRRGLSLGEGSGMLVLVREDLARRAGLPILAEVLGYGLSADGYHPTAPHPEGEGAARAIREALRVAGVSPGEVAYVNSHGTGTAKNDPAETRATRRGLGEAADRVAVSSTKSMIGHLLGAAGAVEAIVTVKALEEQVAPPTANFTEPDPECDLDYVPNHPRALHVDVAVSNNFAFGGANASIVLARDASRESPPPAPAIDRVVVTGIAALTPAGSRPEDAWDALEAGRALGEDEGGARVARVDIDPSAYLSRKDLRRLDRLGVFAVISSRLALEDAGLEVGPDNRERIGVVFGTGIGPMESMERFSLPLFEEGPAGANPAVFPNTVYNAAPGQVAIHLGAVGPSSTVTAGHAAGASSLCYGADLLRTDHADAVLCLAADTLTETVVAGYRALGLVAGRGGPGADGEGLTLAEGGVALLGERLSRARARGARIYGEVLGYGIASDGRGVASWDPRGSGLERAMRIALESSGLDPDDVETVWSGASGYRPADVPEARALRRVFGRDRGRPRIRAARKHLGEPIGAGGALSAVLALLSWRRGDASGPAVVNSCSFGGTHFSIVLAPPSGGGP